MIKIGSKLKLYLHSTLILSAIAIVLACLSYAFAFDRGVGYFNLISPLPYIFGALCIITAIWLISSFFAIPKNVLDGASPTTLTVNIASTPLALSAAALGALMLVAYFLISAKNIFGDIFPSYTVGNSVLLIICGVFLIATAVYYAFLWFDHGDRGEIVALIGFSLPIASLLLVAVTHFDMHTAMQSPIKLSFQFAMLSFMLFSLYELRTHLGKPRPRLYFFFAALTVLLSGIASFPLIVAYILGYIPCAAYLLYAIFTLCVFIYTLTRLCTFVSARCLLERISDQTPIFEPEPIDGSEKSEETEELSAETDPEEEE